MTQARIQSDSVLLAPPVRPAARARSWPTVPANGNRVDHAPRHIRGTPRLVGRIEVDGKFFMCNGKRFPFHGVSYGTFAPRSTDGAQFPEPAVLVADLEKMAEAGFTVVRTYTSPPNDLLEHASRLGLRVLAGIFYSDWRYIIGSKQRTVKAMVAEAAAIVRREAQRLAGRDEVLAVVIGNEIPADAIRWFGAKRVSAVLGRLAAIVHEVDPKLLVTYANYPTSEYLDVAGIDFLTYNIFLENADDLRRYLTRLHHLAADRPLVLGEIGLDAVDEDGEQRQAEVLDWQLATALERGVGGTCLFSWTDEWWVGGAEVTGWHFGLTRRDRSARPALEVAADWNRRTVADLDFPWPSISVAICAYNAADTLDECLRATSKLDYPRLEILVVDDGSSDATAGIAYRHPRVKLVSIEHAGLSVARNACIAAANGDLIAYLDADAYPTPEWPYYLALAMDGAKVGGAGGPNVPPRDDPIGAHRIAASPGGPVHVLVADDRAEHVPGCNMAFWKTVLLEVGGFNPVFTSAGDDVDVCWKVIDRGWEIGFHPAALVWHHRRPTIKTYLRQQRGYGKAEALVAARHPDRYTGAGTARWRGRIYASTAQSIRQPRIYRGAFAGAAYQSVYGGGGHLVDLAHQVGIPMAAAATVLGVGLGAVLWQPALLVAAASVAFILSLLVYDTASASRPRYVAGRPLVFRGGVGLLHVLQPLARWWGRWKHRGVAHKDLPLGDEPLGRPRRQRRGPLLVDTGMARTVIAERIVARLRRGGAVVQPVTGWEDHDGRISGSVLLFGELLTSAHTDGVVQIRVRRRVRRWAISVGAISLALTALESPFAAIVAGALVLGDVAWGTYRLGPWVRRLIGGGK